MIVEEKGQLYYFYINFNIILSMKSTVLAGRTRLGGDQVVKLHQLYKMLKMRVHTLYVATLLLYTWRCCN